MPKRHQPKSLSNLFADSDSKLAKIAEKTRHIQTLDQCLEDAVGASIASHCRVSNFDGGILTIQTDKAAFATRLKFLQDVILLNFRRHVLPQLADIQVKVVPNEQFYQSTAKNPPPKGKHLSSEAAQSIRDVAANAPDSLKQKLENLANLSKDR